MSKHTLYLLTLGILFFTMQACNTPSAEETTDASTEAVTEPKAEPAATTAYDFPVYQTFDEIEPIFHLENDTTYVINFWATWCKPCVEELPYFEDLHQKYASDKVKVILVSLDFKNQVERKLIPFLAERNLQSEVMLLLDGKYNEWIDRVDPDWGGAIPVTIVYNGQNRAFHGEQFANYEELEAMLKKVHKS